MSVKKNKLTPVEYDEISLVDSGASQEADVLIIKRASCDSPNSTGKKDGKSKRSKNWKEERHPRDKDGKMKESSSDSKSKYGKGGTTQEQLDAECRDKKKSPTKKSSGNPLKRKGGITGLALNGPPKKKKRKRMATPNTVPSSIEKVSAMSSWETDALLRATLERKAT